MHLELSDEQELFTTSLREWLGERADSSSIRGWLDAGDPAAFERLFVDDGWAAVGFGEDLGGQGGGLLELALTAREVGRAAAPSSGWLQSAIVLPALSDEPALMRAATEYFDNGFPGKIFPAMRELIRRLHDAGCEVWAVSSSNEWVIRAAMKHFEIPEERILAAAVKIEDGIITDRLIRVPSGPGKPQALREVVKKQIDAAFGNARWDTEMLAMAKHAFAVNPNPDLEATALQRGWTIYFPDGTHHR